MSSASDLFVTNDSEAALPAAGEADSARADEAASLAAQVDSEWWRRNRERILRKIGELP